MRRPTTRQLAVLGATACLAVALADPFASNAAPAKGITPAPALPNATGLSFGAAVPTDLQRDESEPAVTVDRDGSIYSCGPSGFSQVADYAQVSLDGGDQFHLLGQPPRGQISGGEGGGDCALATAPKKNSQGHYNLAYAGLGPLTNFSTATSPDVGRTFTVSPVSESVPGVDRQWIAFSDDKTAFFNYNSTALGMTVQKSTDGGLTYDTPGTKASPDSGRIGQIHAFTPKGYKQPWVYFPYTSGTSVKLSLSQDGGKTFSTCRVINDGTDTSAGFAAADNDDQGNVYVTYAEKGGGRDTYLVAGKFSALKNCKGGNKYPGFGDRILINRGDVATTVMPWVAASGLPGRAAVAFYGTRTDGNPDLGSIKASWDVYVGQTLDAFAAHPQISLVKATTHPFHYDSICLGGLGCDLAVPAGDRTLADYFTMEFNRKTRKLVLVFSQTAKKPGEAAGHVSTPVVVVQNGGQSNAGGTVHGPAVVRTTSEDHPGDAFAYYSTIGGVSPSLGSQGNNVAALDFVGKQAVKVTGAPDGGLTVTFRLNNISDASLQDALTRTTSTSLMWLFRFVNGYQGAAAQATWAPGKGFGFGFDDYTTTNVQCPPGSDAEKCVIYPGAKAMTGSVDQKANTITLRIPRAYLKGLSGSEGNNSRPVEVAGGPGTRLYDAGGFSLANPSIPGQVQSYMMLVDNAPTMDVIVPKATGGSLAGETALLVLGAGSAGLGLRRGRRTSS